MVAILYAWQSAGGFRSCDSEVKSVPHSLKTRLDKVLKLGPLAEAVEAGVNLGIARGRRTGDGAITCDCVL